MSTLDYIGSYILLVGLLMAVDYGWVRIGGGRLYRRKLGQDEYEDMQAAHRGLIYALIGLGLLVMVVVPAIDSGDFKRLMLLSALFGFVSHGLVEMSNAGILKHWTDKLILLDLFWSAFLSFFASVATYLIVSGIQA